MGGYQIRSGVGGKVCKRSTNKIEPLLSAAAVAPRMDGRKAKLDEISKRRGGDDGGGGEKLKEAAKKRGRGRKRGGRQVNGKKEIEREELPSEMSTERRRS